MTRPELVCCKAHIAYAPSGTVWLHGGGCPRRRGQKVTEAEIQAAKSGHPAGTSGNVNIHFDPYTEFWLDRDDEQAEWEVEP